MIPLVETTFKNMQPSDTLSRLIVAEAAKLERFYGRIVRCRVLVEKPHHHRRGGVPYHVRIEIDVPGNAIVVGDARTGQAAALLHGLWQRAPGELEGAHRYAEVAVQDAFRRAGRRLQDYAQRQAGEVKTHEAPPTASVAVLKEEYGFLRTPDERQIYFHRNSVRNGDFDRLSVGSPVRFVEEDGENGPQATSVTPLRG